MQCYNCYALFSLPGLLLSLKSSILSEFPDLFSYVYEKVVYEKRGFAKSCLYLEMGIANF